MVVDRKEVEKAQNAAQYSARSNAPGDNRNYHGKREFSEINSKIKSANQHGNGQWTLALYDDSVWVTIEIPSEPPRTGDNIHVKRAALGSYFANINGQRAVRVHRVG